MLRRQTDETDPADWFWFAQSRLKAADAVWTSEGLVPSVIEELQEAVERFLKGFLIAKGWRLEKIHDLKPLLDEAVVFDARFAPFATLAEDLTDDFYASHYPGGDLTDVGDDYEQMRQQADELVALIKTLLPQHFPAA